MTTAKPRDPNSSKLRLGWREWVALPDLALTAVKAKVDTGARSSSLHAEEIEVFDRDGAPWVRFVVGQDDDPNLRSEGSRLREMPLLDARWITSSNGSRQQRPVIRTTVVLHGRQWPIDLSLSGREAMGFPMLLGREAMRRRFVVDPGRSFLSSDPVPPHDDPDESDEEPGVDIPG